MLKRIWLGLPRDGLGWQLLAWETLGREALAREPRQDSILLKMRAWAASDWRRAYPLPMQALLWLADRAGWPLAAMSRTLTFARARGLGGAAATRLFFDCLLTGGTPMEAHVWRALQAGRHPLPARSASLVLSRLGDPAGHALLADKLSAAERLAAAGGVFPALLGLHARGEGIDLNTLAGMASSDGVFLKPRHGYGGRDAFALTRTDTGWRLDGQPVETARLLARLANLCRNDDLLVQERLVAAATMTDLASDGRAPVLRLGTARFPGEAPFLHSALLTIAVPGRSARDFLDGGIHAPVDPSSGSLTAGVSFRNPHGRLDTLSWNQARLAGRPVPAFAEATAMALQAMAALPPLALVHWDIIITDQGPVLLEGNTCGNWILACLPGFYGLDSGPLPPILARWKPVEQS